MRIKADVLYKLIGLGLFLYMIFILGKTSIMNYKINSQINDLKTMVEDLAEDNKKIAEDIEYYKTEAYKEKVARQRLGLKKPEEEVLVVIPDEEGDEEEERKEYANYVKWWFFVNGKNL